MGGAREAVNDERVPGVPGRIRVTRRATEQTQKDGNRGDIRSGEEEFVEKRAV